MSAEQTIPAKTDEQSKSVPHPLKIVEAAFLSATSDVAGADNTKPTLTDSSLASIKLTWLEQVSADTEVSDAAFKVGHKILQYINKRERCAWPKLSTIAIKLKKSERSVRDSVHELAHRMHLNISKRGSGNLNKYELILNELSIEDRDRSQAEAVAMSKSVVNRRRAAADAASADCVSAKAFDTFIEAFPAREAKHDLARARTAYETNLKSGKSADMMLAGALAYRAFCDAQTYTGTSQVYGAHFWLEIGGWKAADPDDFLLDDGGWA